MNDDNKRAIIAVVISGLILFGWQFYFAPKPAPVVEKTNIVSTTQSSTEQTSLPVNSMKIPEQALPISDNLLTGTGGTLTFKSDFSVASISNNHSVFDFQSVVEADEPLKLFIKLADGLKAIPLRIEARMAPTRIEGVNDQYGIKAIITPNNAAGRYDVAVTSATPNSFVFKMKSSKKELQNRQIRQLMTLTNDVERSNFGDAHKVEGTVKWVGVDFNYHIFALIFPEKIGGVVNLSEAGDFTFTINEAKTNLNFSYIFAKKNYDDLVNLGDNLNLTVDFGILGIVAVPLLHGLQFFYKFFPNYGVAIIILTLLVRLATFPLQYKSFKSMKKMQELQPEMNKIKEKYKDDAQKMQKETMDLFKRAGTNPLGGCLPLLAQMPVFFAFYKVLYSAVELVNAPFFGWIHDLSAKDPFYIFPLLMTGAMFLQQKMTPTTSVDPTQQKIMLFMPLIFGLIMKDLPSGLVLYIFVSTLAGIIQQMLVYKTTD